MKVMHIETTDGRHYSYTVQCKSECANLLLTLKRLGVLCKKWWYEEASK